MIIRFAQLILLVFLLMGCSPTVVQLPGASGLAADEEVIQPELMPSPELSPQDVVKIQVEALKNNDREDTGIEITFRFASPANKQVTGPLSRFKQMVRDPAYRPMLNHKLAEFEPITISGDTATQRVTIIERNGQAAVYLFSLSRQDLSTCQGCWMTDSVLFVPTRKQGLKQI